MKRCINCGTEINSNSRFCEACGGSKFETIADTYEIYCVNCGRKIAGDSTFCEYCGAHVYDDGDGREADPIEISVEPKKRKDWPIILCIVLLAILIVMMAAAMFSFSKKSSEEPEPSHESTAEANVKIVKAEKNKTEKPKIVSEAENDTTEESEEELEPEIEATEVPEMEEEQNTEEGIQIEEQEAEPIEEEPELIVEEPQETEQPRLVVTKRELEYTIDNYVKSYVNAMNTGDSSYMLPYVIPNCPLYSGQKEFIKKANYYEEYIDSYIIGEVKVEDNNTCVVSVYEIYNVEKPDQPLKRAEQTATYSMKRDSDGIWKMYSFVGKVVSHN